MWFGFSSINLRNHCVDQVSTIFVDVIYFARCPHCTPQETPLPGAYRIGTFLDDLHKQPSTYRFRDSSRVKSASHQRFAKCGEALLPGAYEQGDFLSDLAQQSKTYNFKTIQRGQEIKIGHGYGDKVRHIDSLSLSLST